MTHPVPNLMPSEPGSLGLQLVAQMGELTGARINELGLTNARANQAQLHHGNSLKHLRGQTLGNSDRALIVAAGPSLKRQDAARGIKQHGFDGAIVATDSAMLYCLRHDIVPDLVVTLDPHGERIVRWFGNPHLSEEHLAKDDYFARQDMDTSFADQLRANDEILNLLDRYGKRMRIALSTSAAPQVVQRAVDTGMDIYWWNPMYDDPDAPGSLTQQLHAMNKLPSVNAGGNVGAACWMMAHAVLDKAHIGIVGMDFGYYADTPYRNTQYYKELVELFGEARLDEAFVRIFNPHLQQWYYTDPAYLWYRNCFLEMAADAACATYNCTEGGILFGEPIRFVSLREFLRAPR
jgi:hypothetical protein